jgi:hypothetical protein
MDPDPLSKSAVFSWFNQFAENRPTNMHVSYRIWLPGFTTLAWGNKIAAAEPKTFSTGADSCEAPINRQET